MILKIGTWLRQLFHPVRRIVVPIPPPMPDEAVYITVEFARQIITESLGSRMVSR